MNLHEMYQTLLRRGMPEHPRLLWFAGLWMDHHPLKSDRRAAEAHDDDARDLITMWASGWMGKRSQEILKAILAATEHLEPQKS